MSVLVEGQNERWVGFSEAESAQSHARGGGVGGEERGVVICGSSYLPTRVLGARCEGVVAVKCVERGWGVQTELGGTANYGRLGEETWQIRKTNLTSRDGRGVRGAEPQGGTSLKGEWGCWKARRLGPTSRIKRGPKIGVKGRVSKPILGGRTLWEKRGCGGGGGGIARRLRRNGGGGTCEGG